MAWTSSFHNSSIYISDDDDDGADEDVDNAPLDVPEVVVAIQTPAPRAIRGMRGGGGGIVVRGGRGGGRGRSIGEAIEVAEAVTTIVAS